jgi:hypothetical protein
MIKINEGLRAGDLEGTVEKRFSVDQFKSKMGKDDDVLVLSFVVNNPEAAKDFEKFCEKDTKVLDADSTPGTLEDGKYRVFVEFPRQEGIDRHIFDFLNDIKKLTNIDTLEFTYHKKTMPFEANSENLANVLPLTPIAYRKKIDNNIITVKKSGQKESLNFQLHAYGNTQMIMKETKAFLIDDKSMAECMHLTKFFGPYHITKTMENQFIFTKDGNSAVISKYKW